MSQAAILYRGWYCVELGRAMTARSSIGGLLGVAEYAALAQLNRPTDPKALVDEIRRLHRSGLSARDIAAALRLAPDEVVNTLGAPNAESVQC